MKLEERRIPVGDLEIGMYVCRLDRSWAGTPFPLQGLLVRSAEDIARLAEYSDEVYIDIELGIAPTPLRLQRLERSGATAGHVRSDAESFDEELPRAGEAFESSRAAVAEVLDDLRAGREVAVPRVREAVEPIVRSVLRNDDAFFWVESLRKRDEYEYRHAINCSALSAAYGRHIGLPEDELLDMASGGMLLDVGKIRVPDGVLGQPGPLDPRQRVQVRRHVQHALDMFDTASGLPVQVVEMVRYHHERADGSGYPDGLAGQDIPLFARIAGVVDSYDAMTSDRPHRSAIGRHKALQVIYAERGRLYAAEVVEQFMQCLGVYPTGSLVELTSGEVAAVLAQNPSRRLRPRVMVLTHADKSLLDDFRSVDLMVAGDVQILRAVDPGAYGIDQTELFL